LFIIDNSSEDESKKVLKSFEDKLNKIKIIYLSKNMGVAFSRNLGIRVSDSEYISFLDSDDYWSSNKLLDQINFMVKSDNVFTYTDYTPFFSKNYNKIFKKKVITPSALNYEQFINNTCIATSSMIIKRSFIGRMKFPKIALEDYAFKCKVLKKKCTAAKLKNNSMFYRISKNSLSSNKFRNIYWIWYINKKYNKLSLVKRLKSLLLISISSIMRYGFK
jgi:teichuronic acid biosynthesis glycosyltransferase TuaG